MFHPIRGSIVVILLIFLAMFTSALYVSAPHVLSDESANIPVITTPTPLAGKSVLVNLREMTISLRDGTSTEVSMPIISKGKPGSYYETPGGIYENDYKEPNHFSSIGHVYMPYSVHVFGNFFIHGIPYYPDGTKVDSTYSGGCIRLSDEDAKAVYAFIERGTPIIITLGTEYDFLPPVGVSEEAHSIQMTRYMVATISLELLKQDDKVFFNEEATTRKKLLANLLLAHDDTVSMFYASHLGKETFITMMNQKAKALGLKDTVFTDVNAPAQTSNADLARFVDYITTYKSYLRTLSN